MKWDINLLIYYGYDEFFFFISFFEYMEKSITYIYLMEK